MQLNTLHKKAIALAVAQLALNSRKNENVVITGSV